MTGFGSDVVSTLRRAPRALLAGVALLTLVVAFALSAPLWGSPTHQDLTNGLTSSGLPRPAGSGGYPLGTDQLGRDQAARLAYGARVSLTVALVANVTSLLIGALVGVIAGFYGGVTEQLLMRFTDMGLSLPTTLIALVIAALMSSGIIRVVVIVTALFWSYPARLVYGETLRLRRRGFVEAAEASGARGATVIRRHLLPHLSPLIMTYFPLNAVSAVLFEAGISFLGAGINPPTASWGNMVSDGESAISYAPHLIVEPSVCLMITTMAFLLLGEGLKALNPETARVSWLTV